MTSHENGLETDKEDVRLTGTMIDSPHQKGGIGLGRNDVYLIND